MKSKVLYRKHYIGYVTGSLGGRDDAYPEDRVRDFENMEDLAREHGKYKDERYEILRVEEVPHDFNDIIAVYQECNIISDEVNRIEKIRQRIEELERQL